MNVINKANASRVMSLAVEGDPAIGVRILGVEAASPDEILIGPDRSQDYVVYLTLPADAIDGPREEIAFRVTDTVTGESATTPSMLITGAE